MPTWASTTPVGAQAEAMAPVMAALDPTLLVTSDLARARETAALLEKETGLTAIEDPRWREYDLGERTGLTLAEFGERVGTKFDGWWDVHAHVEVARRGDLGGGRRPRSSRRSRSSWSASTRGRPRWS